MMANTATGSKWRFGTVSCMHCGSVAANIADGRLELAPGTQRPLSLRSMRCPRCKGPTYVERELDPSTLTEFAPALRR
jgi:hypothetical protein